MARPRLPNVLVLGCQATGKTLLVKQLLHLVDPLVKVSFDTSPTTGVEVDTISHAKQRFVLREVGSPMLRMWKSFYRKATAVLFLLDLSNPTQISASAIELMNLLSAEALAGKPVLLLLNKVDMPVTMATEEVEALLRLKELQATATQRLDVMVISATLMTGCEEVLDWVADAVARGE
eukprot:PLAT15009.1.p1 GENE.PLAT15009.1~~PLAT15009.1.p1  ORF type:complete len:196 (+),score=64.60 PLAT15009.1:55-588(+)